MLGPLSSASVAPSTVDSSELGREYEDEDTWYHFNGGGGGGDYECGLDTQLVATANTGMSVRMAQYRRARPLANNGDSNRLRPSMKERRDLRDLARDDEMATSLMTRESVWRLRDVVGDGTARAGNAHAPPSERACGGGVACGDGVACACTLHSSPLTSASDGRVSGGPPTGSTRERQAAERPADRNTASSLRDLSLRVDSAAGSAGSSRMTPASEPPCAARLGANGTHRLTPVSTPQSSALPTLACSPPPVCRERRATGLQAETTFVLRFSEDNRERCTGAPPPPVEPHAAGSAAPPTWYVVGDGPSEGVGEATANGLLPTETHRRCGASGQTGDSGPQTGDSGPQTADNAPQVPDPNLLSPLRRRSLSSSHSLSSLVLEMTSRSRAEGGTMSPLASLSYCRSFNEADAPTTPTGDLHGLAEHATDDPLLFLTQPHDAALVARLNMSLVAKWRCERPVAAHVGLGAAVGATIGLAIALLLKLFLRAVLAKRNI